MANEKIDIAWNKTVKQMVGDENGLMQKLILSDTQGGEDTELPVAGCFIAIGHIPNSQFLEGQIGSLPPRLLMMMNVGLFGFRVLVRMRYLRAFGTLPPATQRGMATRWAHGSISVARQLFRGLRATALLA